MQSRSSSGAQEETEDVGAVPPWMSTISLAVQVQLQGRVLDGYSESDWAGCRRAARSTSRGATMFESHLRK